MCLLVRRRGRFRFARLSRSRRRIRLRPSCVVDLPLLPVASDGPPMDRQAARERFDRRQQPLLEANDEQAGGRLDLAAGVGVALLPGGAVFVEQARQLEFGRIRRQPVDDHALSVATSTWTGPSRNCCSAWSLVPGSSRTRFHAAVDRRHLEAPGY